MRRPKKPAHVPASASSLYENVGLKVNFEGPPSPTLPTFYDQRRHIAAGHGHGVSAAAAHGGGAKDRAELGIVEREYHLPVISLEREH